MIASTRRAAPSALFLVQALFALCLAVVAVPSPAQEGKDYYAARLDPSDQLLYNVEKYHLSQGEGSLRTEKYQYAWGDIDFILRYFPNHPRGLQLMSELCLKWTDRRCDADGYFAKALAMNAGAAGTHLVYGIHLQRTKRLDKAIEHYQRAIELDPASANAHYNLGLAYFQKKDLGAANRHAQRAYELGFPLPGLRQNLERAGAWKPTPDARAADTAPPAKAQ